MTEFPMESFVRCECGKILCQEENDTIIIKCRHCKRYFLIRTKGIEKMEFKLKSDLVSTEHSGPR